jgi:hypothetical protein
MARIRRCRGSRSVREDAVGQAARCAPPARRGGSTWSTARRQRCLPLRPVPVPRQVTHPHPVVVAFRTAPETLEVSRAAVPRAARILQVLAATCARWSSARRGSRPVATGSSRTAELDRYKGIGKVLARTGQERAPPKPSTVVDVANLMRRPIGNVGDLDPGGGPWVPTEPAAHLHGLDRVQGRRLPIGSHELGLCVREVQGARREPLVWPQRCVRYTVGKPDRIPDVGHKTPLARSWF